MKKKNKIFLIGAATVSACVICLSAAIGLASSKQLLAGATGSGQWVHYSRREATPSQLGIREYWVECGGVYQFEAPEGVTPTEKGSDYDLSGFTNPDDRYFAYSLNDVYHDLSASLYGASMAMKSGDTYNDASYRINDNGDSFLHYWLYGDGDIWRINLPRIDYREYPHVHMDLTCPNWYQDNYFGPEDDQMTYTTLYGGNKDKGKIELLYHDGTLTMDFYDPEYGNLWFTKTYTDTNVINGLSSPCFYVTDKWDRYLNIDNITLGKHVDNGDGFCTTCHYVIGGHTISSSLFSTVLEPDGNPAVATGFKTSVRQTAKHNTNSYVQSVDLSNYSKLYFAIYASINLKFFSGSAESKPFWTDRWNQFYMEIDGEGVWHAYGKDPSESAYTEITGLNQSSNWKWMFSVIRTDSNYSDEFTIFTTELVGIPK